MRIYSANLAPIIDEEGRELYVIEARVGRFHDFIKELEGIMGEVMKSDDLRSIVSVGGIEALTKVLRLVNDLIVIYFKRLFTVPPAPPARGSKVNKYLPVPSDLLYSYVIARDLGLPSLPDEDLVEIKYDILTKFIESLLGRLGNAVVNKLFSIKPPEKVLRDFIDIVISVPADTRPGLNVSKLVPHMLLTSAIASTKYISRHGGTSKKLSSVEELHLEILRLASLLHDIGKPLSWVTGESHARVSAKLVSTLLRPLEEKFKDSDLANCLSIVKELIMELIEKHHRPHEVTESYEVLGSVINARELARLLADADRVSSATDRLLSKVVPIVAKSEIVKSRGYTEEDLRRALAGVGREVRSFWESFTDEEIRKLSEEVARNLSKSATGYGDRIEPVSDVKVVGIDVRGIQSFIRRESLRAVAAASTLVEILTLYLLPKALIDGLGVPIEALYFAGGGSVTCLAPSWATEELIGKLVRGAKLGVSIGYTYALTDLLIPWVATQRALASALNTRKLVIGPELGGASIRDVTLGIEVMCDSCGRKPAVKYEAHLGYVCDECLKVHEFGEGMYVRYKLKVLESLGYDADRELKDLKDVYKYLMNWLSGAKDFKKEGRYLAIVKADGNSIGSYMAYALTPTEAYLRSVRIDLGTKLGVYVFLKELLNLSKPTNDSVHELSPEELVIRVFTGLMYVGGDDLLALTPSSLSLPLAISVAYWFWRLTGTRTMSVGIACGKPKHNVWLMIDVANKLLKNSKRLCREDLVNNVRDRLLYIQFELGTQQLLPSTIDEVKRVYGGTGLHREPYSLPYDTGVTYVNSLIYLLKPLLSELSSASLNLRSEADYEKLIKGLLGLSASNVKKVRDVSAELMTSLTPLLGRLSNSDLHLKLVAKLTWLANRPSKASWVYKALAEEVLTEYSTSKVMNLPPIRDLLVLTNIVLGKG